MGLSSAQKSTRAGEHVNVEPPAKIIRPPDVPPKNSSPLGIPLEGSSLKNSGGTSALLKQALLSLGLTQDNLNKALFIFTRFFSLPIGQSTNPGGLLAELRRELLNKLQTGNLGEGDEVGHSKTENRALAAAVLADKGVKLSPYVLEAYIRALDPETYAETEGRGSPPDTENFSGNPGNGQQGKNESDQGQSGGGNNNKKKEPSDQRPGAEELRAIFDKFMDLPGRGFFGSSEPGGEKGQIVCFLNAIPGKNGQRWIVWPFSVTINGIELKVLVRLLVKEPLFTAQGRLFVNITGPLNSWRFIIGKSGETFKANIVIYPERRPSALKTLKNEAEKLLAVLGAVEIEVNNGEKFPSLADFLEKETFFPVNEEV